MFEEYSNSDKPLSGRNKYILNEDYYISEEGYWVFTEKYHLKRGYCCKNNCKHCAYKDKPNS